MSNSTGIVFNNEMDDFSNPAASDGLMESKANAIKPAKSPMSSMAPIILLNEHHEVTMVVGGAGQVLLLFALPTFSLIYVTFQIDAQQVAFSL